MKKVLSTKTLNDEIISKARSLNLDVTCIDFIKTIKVDFKLNSIPENIDAIVFTSSNAVNYLFQNNFASSLIENKNVFSVSGKTKEALIKHNIKPLETADNADDLADLILMHNELKSVLHVCGNLALDTLKEKLEAKPVSYFPLVVYETVLLNEIVKDDFDAVMFYSPSGVESFFASNKMNKDALYCCIGNTTGEACTKQTNGAAKIIIADNAMPQSMIDVLAKEFETLNQ